MKVLAEQVDADRRSAGQGGPAPGSSPWVMLRRAVRSIHEAVAARVGGTAYYERWWAERSAEAVRAGFDNISSPHRLWLMDRLERLGPFGSVLEIGCGYGPNVQALASRFSHARIEGWDVNPHSVAAGVEQLRTRGLVNARVVLQGTRDLAWVPDHSFDIVLTDALLLYVAPDQIRTVVSHLWRVARLALVTLELHRAGAGSRGSHTGDGWVRDYAELLSEVTGAKVEPERLPPSLRPSGRWPTLGGLAVARRPEHSTS